MELFGKKWDRTSLLQYVGDIRQIGGAQPVVLDDGPERGVRAVEVRTGTGFVFSILPDRGMDVFRAEYQGASLSWHSPTGPTAPAFFEAEGLGWLRGFYGGMLVTCGLTHVGPPQDGFGLHGRASYLPARDVGITQEWEGDEYRIEIRGKVRETSVFGDNVALTRRIRTFLGSNGFVLEDEVENLGHEPATHMLLYHMNGGFPVVEESTELLLPAAAPEKNDYARFQPPTPGFKEQLYFHRLQGLDKTTVALVNRGFAGGRGLGYALRFSPEQLPCFTEWKMMGQGIYVVGTEPGNVNPLPREALRKEGKLPTLQPGEKRRYQLEFTVLTSAADIRQAEQEIVLLGGR